MTTMHIKHYPPIPDVETLTRDKAATAKTDIDQLNVSAHVDPNPGLPPGRIVLADSQAAHSLTLVQSRRLRALLEQAERDVEHALAGSDPMSPYDEHYRDILFVLDNRVQVEAQERGIAMCNGRDSDQPCEDNAHGEVAMLARAVAAIIADPVEHIDDQNWCDADQIMEVSRSSTSLRTSLRRIFTDRPRTVTVH